MAMQNELLFTGGRKNFEISVWLRKKKNTFSHHNIITSSPPPHAKKERNLVDVFKEGFIFN